MGSQCALDAPGCGCPGRRSGLGRPLQGSGKVAADSWWQHDAAGCRACYCYAKVERPLKRGKEMPRLQSQPPLPPITPHPRPPCAQVSPAGGPAGTWGSTTGQGWQTPALRALCGCRAPSPNSLPPGTTTHHDLSHPHFLTITQVQGTHRKGPRGPAGWGRRVLQSEHLLTGEGTQPGTPPCLHPWTRGPHGVPAAEGCSVCLLSCPLLSGSSSQGWPHPALVTSR